MADENLPGRDPAVVPSAYAVMACLYQGGMNTSRTHSYDLDMYDCQKPHRAVSSSRAKRCQVMAYRAMSYLVMAYMGIANLAMACISMVDERLTGGGSSSCAKHLHRYGLPT